nr:substrate-binding domain-containing protein [uncultured Carboxylicivirga sp.]
MKQEALLNPNIELIIKTVDDDTQQQIRDIEVFIEQKIDLLIVAPNEAAPLTPIIEKAFDNGIPVLLVDRKILSDKYSSFIAADNFQIGREVGNYIVNILNGRGNIVEIKGLEGSTSALERDSGFKSVINKYPEIDLVIEEDAAWLKEEAAKKMKEVLSQYKRIDLVFAHNDRMALGAYEVAKEKDLAHKIIFIGIDALSGKDEGVEQILKNKLKASFVYPTGGDKIIQLAWNILNGTSYQKNNTLYTALIDQTNAQIFKLQSDEIINRQKKIQALNDKIVKFSSQYSLQRYLLLSISAIVVLLIGLFVFLIHAYRSKNRLNIKLEEKKNAIEEQKNTVELQRDHLMLLSSQLEEATNAKLLFFTNISHEFRTPLTLISGPIETLLEDPKIDKDQYRLLNLAGRNVNVLLNLVDQIIDFRKLENDKLPLHLSNNDLRNQLKACNEVFSELIDKRQLDFDFQVAERKDYTSIYDLDKMERIYFNLLSNALKYTPVKGTIVVKLQKIDYNNQPFINIQISNSGTSISIDNIQHIFDRFYQVDSSMHGSGIGLAFVRDLVELHNGTIKVESQNEITTFIVNIPFVTDLDKAKQPSSVINDRILDPIDFISDLDILDDIESEEDLNQSTVLVVDDNPDIRIYIKSILRNKYNVLDAEDGKEGIVMAAKHIPDIIVCDVMMPEIDGLDLCKKLKSEFSTCHIPIVLLTARTLDEQRIVGFETGADDYISKPFNSKLLEVRIRKLIENRNKLREVYAKQLLTGVEKSTLNIQDKRFLEKFHQIVEDHIADPELNVENLGKSIGLSRVQLYRKIKAITNYSPNELVKIIRLKKAYSLFSTGEKTVSEVAYDTGFTSPSYFAKCFKEFYNESPSSMLKRMECVG